MKATITYKGIDFDMEYVYTPAERGVWRDADGGGYPDTEALVEIISIKFKGEDFTEFLEDNFEDIERVISCKNYDL
jgi:hypothetical protein